MWPPTEMPPMPCYDLLAPIRDERPIVRFQRVLCAHEQQADAAQPDSTNVQGHLRRWLQAIGRHRTKVACQLDLDRSVSAISDVALRRLVRLQRHRGEREFAAMARELQARREITVEQLRALVPQIRLELIDARGGRSRPLPSAAWLMDEND